ncbi:MAG TPA: PIN domain-containing protein [Spirochaetota bacterium]|nr:PIN domain-containing protein [Spirochaetota bacterium]
MIKVFLDSNIIFSIVYIGDAQNKLYDIYFLSENNKLKVYISDLVKLETEKNILSKKNRNYPFLKDILKKTIIVKDVFEEFRQKEINQLPLNDKIILSTAIHYKIDFFITGNKNDFNNLYFKKFDNTIVLKPSDFININF